MGYVLQKVYFVFFAAIVAGYVQAISIARSIPSTQNENAFFSVGVYDRKAGPWTSYRTMPRGNARVDDLSPLAAFGPVPSRKRKSLLSRSALLDTSMHAHLTEPCLLLSSLSDSPALEPTAVSTLRAAFNVATFLPQPFWVLLILLPNAKITKKIMGGLEVVTFFALVHFTIVVASIVQPDATAPLKEFNDVFDPTGNPQAAMIHMMTYPNFVSEEWSHVLTWDLFVGRWIWLDGLRRGIFTPHSVLLSNLIGPPGLLLHFATCLVTGNGITSNEAVDIATEQGDKE